MKTAIQTMVLVLATVGCRTAQERSTELLPIQEVRYEQFDTSQLVLQWLSKDCDLPAEPRLIAVLTQRREQVVPILRAALSSGPPKDVLAATEREARNRIEAARRLLDDPERTGLAPEDLERARRSSIEDALRRARVELETNWAEQALRGLAAILGPDADSLIQAAAANPEDPAHDAARILQRNR